MLPVLREHHYTYCIPVISGRNVWVGANVSILPGVTIGDNCVIGAGSVVTHSIPANSVTYGARNLRRTIQKELEDPISEAIIDSFQHPISAIRIRVEGETVKLDIT